MNHKIPVITIAINMPISSPESVNSYLIPVEPYTLIDAGFKSFRSASEIYGVLEKSGVALSRIERIIITHGHPDHFGMAKELQEKTGAEVFIHAEDEAKVRGDYDLFQKVEFFTATGTPPKVRDVAFKFEQALNSMSEPLDELTVIESDYRFLFQDFSLEVLHLPGHSSGHICLYSPEERLLFSGDLVLPTITAIPVLDDGGKNLSVVQLMDSLSRLMELPVDKVYPGHGDSIDRPHGLIRSRKEFYARRLEEFYGWLLSRPPQNTFELAMAYFQQYREIKGFDMVLATAETMANLEVLIHQKRINFEIRNGVSYFFANGS